ncbi:MAG: hypothetical protein MZU95_03735 [Desulfomicrobium escambiense]|nr:hypothetical protein [Desulfomicrobium escambiense]
MAPLGPRPPGLTRSGILDRHPRRSHHAPALVIPAPDAAATHASSRVAGDRARPRRVRLVRSPGPRGAPGRETPGRFPRALAAALVSDAELAEILRVTLDDEYRAEAIYLGVMEDFGLGAPLPQHREGGAAAREEHPGPLLRSGDSPPRPTPGPRRTSPITRTLRSERARRA